MSKPQGASGEGLKSRMRLRSRRLPTPALGNTLPKSVLTSIREQVMKYGLHVTEMIKHDLFLKKSKGDNFSFTLDEWTSVRNRRYLNLNIHWVGYFWNLGLVRIQGIFSAEKCIETISSKPGVLNRGEISAFMGGNVRILDAKILLRKSTDCTVKCLFFQDSKS